MSATSSEQKGTLNQHQSMLDQGVFQIQLCQDCQQHIYFPREVCPHCGGNHLSFVTPTGWGTVYAVTTVRRKATDGGDYNVSLIDLDEGPRLMSQVTDVAPEQVHIDQRVKAHVVMKDGRGVVMFTALNGVNS